MAEEAETKAKHYWWPRRKFEQFLAPAGDGSKGSLFWLFVIALAFVLIIFGYALIARPGVDGGVFGDLVGGTLNPVLTFLTFMALLITIVLQQSELRATKDELAKSATALVNQITSLDRQNFEATFFQMLTLHNSIVGAMDVEITRISMKGPVQVTRHKGRDCFEYFFETYSKKYADTGEMESEQSRLQAAYDGFWDSRQQDLAHYFRYLYNILRFVHEQPGIADKKRYIKLLRAQLSDYELVLLFYTAVNRNGINYWLYIHEYELFDNLPPDKLIAPGHKSLYSPESFGAKAAKAYEWPPAAIARRYEAMKSFGRHE